MWGFFRAEVEWDESWISPSAIAGGARAVSAAHCSQVWPYDASSRIALLSAIPELAWLCFSNRFVWEAASFDYSDGGTGGGFPDCLLTSCARHTLKEDAVAPFSVSTPSWECAVRQPSRKIYRESRYALCLLTGQVPVTDPGDCCAAGGF